MCVAVHWMCFLSLFLSHAEIICIHVLVCSCLANVDKRHVEHVERRKRDTPAAGEWPKWLDGVRLPPTVTTVTALCYTYRKRRHRHRANGWVIDMCARLSVCALWIREINANTQRRKSSLPHQHQFQSHRLRSRHRRRRRDRLIPHLDAWSSRLVNYARFVRHKCANMCAICFDNFSQQCIQLWITFRIRKLNVSRSGWFNLFFRENGTMIRVIQSIFVGQRYSLRNADCVLSWCHHEIPTIHESRTIHECKTVTMLGAFMRTLMRTSRPTLRDFFVGDKQTDKFTRIRLRAKKPFLYTQKNQNYRSRLTMCCLSQFVAIITIHTEIQRHTHSHIT